MHVHGISSGIPHPVSPVAHTPPAPSSDSSLIQELGAVDTPDDMFDTSDQTGSDATGSDDLSSTDASSNPYTQALAAASVLPIADAAGPGPAKIETFSSTGSPASSSSSVYAVITKGADTVAVIDGAGNVSVRGPADESVRDAMAQLSAPADRTAALAQLLGGSAQLADGQTGDLSDQIQALTQNSTASAGDGSGFTTVSSAIEALTATSVPSSAELQQADSQFESLFAGGNESAAEMLHNLTSDGMDGYWKEELKQITNQVANQVLAGMGLTKEQVEAMPPAQRMAIENAITKTVEERVKDIIKEQMKKHQANQAAAQAPQGTQDTSKTTTAQPAADLAKIMGTASSGGQSSSDASITGLLTDAF